MQTVRLTPVPLSQEVLTPERGVTLWMGSLDWMHNPMCVLDHKISSDELHHPMAECCLTSASPSTTRPSPLSAAPHAQQSSPLLLHPDDTEI